MLVSGDSKLYVAFGIEFPLGCHFSSAEIKEPIFLAFQSAFNFLKNLTLSLPTHYTKGLCFLIQLQGNVVSAEAWLSTSAETVMRTGTSLLARLNSSVKSAIHR